MRRSSRSLVTGVIASLVVGVGPLATASSAEAGPYCGIYWGSLAKKQARQVHGPITNVRAGHHACFDRLVFDMRGTAAGYRVAYVSDATMGIPLRGGSQLRVEVQASRFPYGDCWLCSEDPQFDPRYGWDVVNLDGFPTIRQVAIASETAFKTTTPDGEELFAGGETEFGVGVRARLPFRVFRLQDATTSRLVIDVAHRW